SEFVVYQSLNEALRSSIPPPELTVSGPRLPVGGEHERRHLPDPGRGDLVEMREQPYDSEDVLQELIARHPNLLAGDQMDNAAPRRWLLVTREMGVPDEQDGGDRWSLDHLFLDQDAVPTLVEVKRSSDTRVRREVVGQMLDYAANAVVYWPVEAIRS